MTARKSVRKSPLMSFWSLLFTIAKRVKLMNRGKRSREECLHHRPAPNIKPESIAEFLFPLSKKLRKNRREVVKKKLDGTSSASKPS